MFTADVVVATAEEEGAALETLPADGGRGVEEMPEPLPPPQAASTSVAAATIERDRVGLAPRKNGFSTALILDPPGLSPASDPDQ